MLFHKLLAVSSSFVTHTSFSGRWNFGRSVQWWPLYKFFGYIGIFCPFDICIHEQYMTFKPDNCSPQQQQRLTQYMHEVPMATGVNANWVELMWWLLGRYAQSTCFKSCYIRCSQNHVSTTKCGKVLLMWLLISPAARSSLHMLIITQY